ncbi:MAG: SH3 domain-containing protein [Deltaproteobacteria bacterium]|nr:SH3 domain-containing protein [Deltaproteobacteria bacterium]
MTRIAPTFRAVLALTVFVACAAAPSARAAQDAIITVEQAAIREYPALDAKILEARPVGVKLRVSSYSKDGWYKTKANIGQYGWIWQGDLSLLTFNADVKAADLDLPERTHDRRAMIHTPWLFFRLVGGVLPVVGMVGETSGHLHVALDGAAELSIRFTDSQRFAVRLMSWSSVFAPGLTNDADDVIPSGTSALIGFEHDFSTTDTQDFTVALFGGETLSHSVGITLGGNTVKTVSETGYTFLFNLAYKRHLLRWLAVVGEAGFFYTYTPQLPIQSFGSSHVSEYGPRFNIGLQFGL